VRVGFMSSLAPVEPVGPPGPVLPVGPPGPVLPVGPPGPVLPVGPPGPVLPVGLRVVVGVVVEVDVLVDVEVLVEVEVPVVRVVVTVVRVVVEVVPLSGVLTGDAAAWAGTMTDSTTGLIHLEGRRIVTVRPATVNSRTRRRVVLPSLIEMPRFA
jgi:hypothetical protein